VAKVSHKTTAGHKTKAQTVSYGITSMHSGKSNAAMKASLSKNATAHKSTKLVKAPARKTAAKKLTTQAKTTVTPHAKAATLLAASTTVKTQK
jgi:hypothetical protein